MIKTRPSSALGSSDNLEGVQEGMFTKFYLPVLVANFWIPTTRIMRLILRPESFSFFIITDQYNLDNGADSGPRITSSLLAAVSLQNEMNSLSLFCDINYR